MKKRRFGILALLLCFVFLFTACDVDLADAKTDKIGELTVYTQTDYRAAEWTTLSGIYNDAVDAIKALTDKAAVEAYDVTSVNTQMSQVKTDAQLTKEEADAAAKEPANTAANEGADAAAKALADAKSARIGKLTVYKQAAYRTAEWAALCGIYNDAVSAINALTDKAAVEAYDVTSVNTQMSQVKTDTQLTKEEANAAAKELADAKTAQIGKLPVYNQSAYRAAEWTTLSGIYNDAVSAINALTDKKAVETYDVSAASVRMSLIKTKAQLENEEAAAAKTLADAKHVQIGKLTVYKISDYRIPEWTALSGIYDDAVSTINALTDKAAVEAYNVASVNTRMEQIKTNAQLTAEEEAARPAPTITTTLENGRTYKSDRFTIDVFAKDNNNQKIASSVTLNGVSVDVNWDDAEKTSFTLFFTQKENNVIISASDGKKKTDLNYTVYYEEDAITITFAADAFTVGGGYLIAPTNIKVNRALLTDMAQYFRMDDADQMKSALNGAYLLEYLLSQENYTSDYTGRIDSGYYIATVYGFNYDGSGASVPANLREAVESAGDSIDESTPSGGLGEFCFTWMSGWMYSVNGIFANVGMSDYYPQDGDIWRLQFTLYGYGTDIGNGGWGSDPIFEQVGTERDALTVAMANAIEQGKESCEEYVAAYNLIQQFGMTPAALTSATAALNAVLD